MASEARTPYRVRVTGPNLDVSLEIRDEKDLAIIRLVLVGVEKSVRPVVEVDDGE